MRFRSSRVGGYQVFAVSGVNTMSFAIDASGTDTNGLLGFAVEREDPAENERYFMPGFKVFPEVIPNPDEQTKVSTFDHPVQSFVWDDFTAKAGRTYRYHFHPLKGQPKNLDRSASPVSIEVRTEQQFEPQLDHEVFFNRGVAGSQAYARKFGNKAPDRLAEPERQRALDWLSRDLDDALLRFIAQAAPGDTLLCCFYEFRYAPAALALKNALERGVHVQLIIDAKVNEFIDKKGVFHESFPREDNLRLIADTGLPTEGVLTLRQAKPNDIQHNKFMVLLKGADETPAAVWTGSTNLSVGGIHGQTNVGHWVRDASVAERFRDYWRILCDDPGGLVSDSRSEVLKKNNAFKDSVAVLQAIPTRWHEIPQGTTAVFSPRKGLDVLKMYAQMLDDAQNLACITLAFGVNNLFKELLQDNTDRNALAFVLLEKRDVPNPRSKQPFIRVNASNNVYQAWGSFLNKPLERWARETSAGRLELNKHVSFIHSKFLLMDPLGDDPIVVTGSANFSEPSTNANDENMLLIRGHLRVADIYFTEFNRLFNHYYFRSVAEATAKARAEGAPPPADGSLMLTSDDRWLQKYAPGKLRAKRVQAFVKMRGIVE
jgi:phosphatidylserine/phosphatidylglycerophosphate/cardiolipin synthase-like enzyme